MKPLESVGECVREWRKVNGVCQNAFAKMLGISATHLCDLEAGKRHWTEPMWNKATVAMKRILAEKTA